MFRKIRKCTHQADLISYMSWSVNRTSEYLQHQRYNGQELPVASELLAIVHLLPPSQTIINPLVFSKWSSLLPMEENISDLEKETKNAIEEIVNVE